MAWGGSNSTQISFTQLILHASIGHKFIQQTDYFRLDTNKSYTLQKAIRIISAHWN